jgi:hypothetical protein
MNFLVWLASALSQPVWYQARPRLVPTSGNVVFNDSRGPLSSLFMTRREIPPGSRDIGAVRGESCQHSFASPLSLSLRAAKISGAYGNGGFKKAFANIRRDYPGISGVYDVRIDLRHIVLLDVYQRLCVEVAGRGFVGARPSSK